MNKQYKPIYCAVGGCLNLVYEKWPVDLEPTTKTCTEHWFKQTKKLATPDAGEEISCSCTTCSGYCACGIAGHHPEPED